MSHKHDQHGHHTKADFEAELTHHDDWFRHAPSERHQSSHGSTNPWAISGVMIAVIIITFGVAFYALNYFNRYQAQLKGERQEKLTDTSPDWGNGAATAKANWDATLHSYGWADAKTGAVQVPMNVAMDKVKKQYEGKAAKK